MTTCTLCGQRATANIPSTPNRVCLEHAIEFWTGLLAFATNRSADSRSAEPTPAAALELDAPIFAAA
jgi:hypothetical protein